MTDGHVCLSCACLLAGDGEWEFYVMNPNGSSEESDPNDFSDDSADSSTDMTRTHFSQSAEGTRSRREHDLPADILTMIE